MRCNDYSSNRTTIFIKNPDGGVEAVDVLEPSKTGEITITDDDLEGALMEAGDAHCI